MNLKTLREKAGLTQFELAVRSGVSVSTIANLETGHRDSGKTTLVILQKLALALECSLDDIIGTKNKSGKS
jgi:transcriptional regulator with XRE-family HTH domain